jgi:adenine-specific DNA-methyltransferase
LRNEDVTERQLNYIVQRIIDRIVFLRICEDRGIEQPDILKSIAAGKDVYKNLLKLFMRADDRYDSGLFHFRSEKGNTEVPDTLSDTIMIDDKVLKAIINSLYYPAPYEFSVFPADILGSVYERFLGKVIRLTTGHHAKVEQKPEVRKAGGVYYTPQYIVKYIVANTIGKTLEGKKPSDIKSFRILDPACGSGSFLIEAYQYLLDWYLNQYIKQRREDAKKKLPQITRISTDEYQLTITERKRILTVHIFGVDIDSQAVEVTKLSLLLKALEGMNNQVLQQELFNERVLPNLADNIKCGNSLVGTDFYSQGTLGLTEDEQYKINPFDWSVFGGQFDVVIGNPPYVRMQTMDKKQTDYFREVYKSAGFGNYDLYILFIEKAYSLLNKTGLYGMILPHKFFTAEYGEGIRKVLADGNAVVQINDFTTNQVFTSATTYTCLLFLAKQSQADFHYQRVTLGQNIQESLKDRQFTTVSSDKLNGKWNFGNSAQDKIFAKITEGSITLEAISRKIFKGSSTGNDDIFLVKMVSYKKDISTVHSTVLDKDIQIETALLKPFIYGQDVRRYYVNKTDIYLIFPYTVNERASLIPYSNLKKKYPLTAHYFGELKPLLTKRKITTTAQDFYKYSAGRSLTEYNQSKILVPDMLIDSRMSVDTEGVYFHGPAIHSVVIKPEYAYMHSHYIAGIISSKLFWYFIVHTSTALRGDTFRLTPEYIGPFPIKDCKTNKKGHDAIVNLVDQILALKQKEAVESVPQSREMLSRQIGALDKTIDKAVYELYGLSDDEIAIVEGK